MRIEFQELKIRSRAECADAINPVTSMLFMRSNPFYFRQTPMQLAA